MSTSVSPARAAIPRLIAGGRVVAIGRRVAPERVPWIAQALAEGGVTAVELTLNEPEAEALAAIEALAHLADDLGVVVGAGTVLSIAAAERAASAGASFIVSPHTDPALVRWCAERGLPCFPGALSPTEILAAWQAGASAVKLFPAAAVGPGYPAQIGGPFPKILLMPTGGVTAETAAAWIAAGAVAVGIGGWLIGDGEPLGVRARARQVRQAIDGTANERPAADR